MFNFSLKVVGLLMVYMKLELQLLELKVILMPHLIEATCTVVGQSNKNRAGAETGRTIKLGSAALNASQKVTLGQMTYNLTVNYGQGDTLLTSKGNKASLTPQPTTCRQCNSKHFNLLVLIHIFVTELMLLTGSGESSMPSGPTPDTKLPLKKNGLIL